MSFWKYAPYAAGGVGLAALENKVLGSNLPDPLKKINLGIGATQGAMFGMGDKSRLMALGSIPAKQMSLFALGEAEQFKQQQQNLTDTNLNTARVNESAAKLHLRDAGTSRAIQLAFLIPALVGAGALGYDAYSKFKKEHKPQSKFKNLTQSGEHKPNQRLRLEMPISALPSDFVPSILAARDRSRVTVKERDDDDDETSGRRRKTASSTLGNIGNIALDFTGIPNFLRGGKDLMHSFGSLQDSDYGNSARYVGAGLGNLALGAVAMRFGAAPVLGSLLGKARLRGVIRNALKGESAQMTEAPTAARYLYRHSFLSDAAGKNPLNQYDPQRYAWSSPTTDSGLFRSLLTEPGSSAGPRSLLGTAGLGAKYLGNRAVDTGYRAKQFMKRWPNLTLSAFGMHLANRGTAQDDAQAAQEKAMRDKWTPVGENYGPAGMPVSSVASGILRALSGSPEPISQQLGSR